MNIKMMGRGLILLTLCSVCLYFPVGRSQGGQLEKTYSLQMKGGNLKDSLAEFSLLTGIDVQVNNVPEKETGKRCFQDKSAEYIITDLLRGTSRAALYYRNGEGVFMVKVLFFDESPASGGSIKTTNSYGATENQDQSHASLERRPASRPETYNPASTLSQPAHAVEQTKENQTNNNFSEDKPNRLSKNARTSVAGRTGSNKNLSSYSGGGTSEVVTPEQAKASGSNEESEPTPSPPATVSGLETPPMPPGM
ncbi:MAG: hypothetical protein V1816_12130 [Pseudomonadota bacterium]